MYTLYTYSNGPYASRRVSGKVESPGKTAACPGPTHLSGLPRRQSTLHSPVCPKTQSSPVQALTREKFPFWGLPRFFRRAKTLSRAEGLRAARDALYARLLVAV